MKLIPYKKQLTEEFVFASERLHAASRRTGEGWDDIISEKKKQVIGKSRQPGSWRWNNARGRMDHSDVHHAQWDRTILFHF